MANWHTSPGGLTGYDAASATLVRDALLFTSAGSVDVNGITRLQYNTADVYPSLDQIIAQPVIDYSGADIAAAGDGFAWASMFVVSASSFAAGVVPTSQQILDAGPSVFRATAPPEVLASLPGGGERRKFTIYGPRASQLTPGTKYWVLVMPTLVQPDGIPTEPSVANDVPFPPNTANVIGRSLSVWTNRAPQPPTITAPASGTVVSSGAVVTLSYENNDDDAMVGSDDYDYRDDAGVQVQYAARATADNPSPVWTDLPIVSPTSVVQDGWFIKGSTAFYPEDTHGAKTLWETQTIDIKCSDDVIADHGMLSAGDWQIRMRTFDFGHPYPTGIPPAMEDITDYTPSTYPAANISAWSTPVLIKVETQIPPPIPLSPIDNIAVAEDQDVTLRWRYRNTFLPPYPQAGKQVQIRALGGEWTTLIGGGDGDDPNFVLADAVVTEPTSPTLERTWDFESAPAGVDGWATDNGLLSRSLVESHGGSASLFYEALVSGTHECHVDFPIDPGTTHEASLWYLQDDLASTVVEAGIKWLTADEVEISRVSITDTPSGVWQSFIAGDPAPLGAVIARVFVEVDGSAPTLYVDDITLTFTSEAVPYDFPLVATSQYEWRVRVSDTDGEISDWSQVARFWVVPAGASVGTRPLPSETIAEATLGCGTYRAKIYRRGGLLPVGEIRNISSLDWNRIRDDISTSKITVSGWDVDCGKLLSLLQTWAYEVVLFRDNGFTVDRVWEGPITLLTYETDKVVIEAKDVMGYVYRRILKQAMNDIGDGDTVTSRAARVLRNCFAPDDPNVLAYLQVLASEGDAREYRNTPAYSRTGFEEVDDMAANAGLDYTAVGRAILLWGTKHRIGTLPEFKDADLGSPPIVSEYGMSFANRYVVSDGSGVWGEATRLDVSGNDENYGLVEMLSSSWASDSPEEEGTYTAEGLATVIESFEGYAERSISDRYPPPVVVRVPDNTTLNPDAVISIQHLVPGVVVPLRSTGTLRKVAADQKLDQVKVVVENGKETVSITLSPFSRDDTTTEEVEA